MKTNKKKFLFSLIALASRSLASCGGNTGSAPTLPSEAPSITTPSSTVKEDSASSSVKEETKYAVSFVKSDKVSIEIISAQDGKALPGEEVSFSLTSSEEEILSVTSSTCYLIQKGNQYVFTRPSHNVEIEVKSEAFGDPSILNVKDVDVSALPNNVASFKEYFKKARSVEGTYFKKGKVINDNFSGRISYYDYDIEAGKNDVLVIKGHQKSNASDSYSTYYSKENGKQGDTYYSISSTSSLGSTPEVSTSYAFKTIIPDDSASVGLGSIKEGDAKAGYSSFGGSKSIYDRFFADNATYALQDYTGSLSSYSYYLKDIKKSVAQDKKSASFDLKAYYTSWSGTDVYNISFTRDGDYFLKEAKLSKVSYDEEECDKDTKLPLDTAKGTVKASYQNTNERGYKSTLVKSDISSFARDDYDVSISYTLSGGEHKTDSQNIVVENGSTLSFTFLPKDNKPTLILPHLKRIEEGDDFVDTKTLTVLKEGEITLVFDNGFGKEKKIKITSVQPKAASLSIKAPSNVYLNETSSRTITVLPEKANQEVTITKNSDSVGEAEFTKQADGSYLVKGTKLGLASYLVASTENADIKETITINVIEKPNAATFKANVLSKTFYGESTDYKGVVNFNADGTGKYKTASKSYYDSPYESEASFTWTFDENTLTFTIIGAQGSYFDNSGFISFVAISDNEAIGTFIHYTYSDSSNFTLSRKGEERKDLSEFN